MLNFNVYNLVVTPPPNVCMLHRISQIEKKTNLNTDNTVCPSRQGWPSPQKIPPNTNY